MRTSPMRRMFSVRDFSSKPRSLLSPNRMLSPSRRYVNLHRCRRCCSSAQAIVDCPRAGGSQYTPRRITEHRETYLPARAESREPDRDPLLGEQLRAFLRVHRACEHRAAIGSVLRPRHARRATGLTGMEGDVSRHFRKLLRRKKGLKRMCAGLSSRSGHRFG